LPFEYLITKKKITDCVYEEERAANADAKAEKGKRIVLEPLMSLQTHPS
jgi:hypothetical protein